MDVIDRYDQFLLDSGAPVDAVREISTVIRGEFGGGKNYIRKKSEFKDGLVMMDYMKTRSCQDVAKKHSLNRSTVFRVLKKKGEL